MKTTEENNRMIAEFMGGKYNGQTSLDINLDEIWLPFHGVCHLHDNGKILKYHTSWDWLMPVVGKIESLGYSVNISRIKVSINHIGSEEEMFSWVCGDPSKKMEILYETLLQFIEWYNKNK